jgi:hypothetical protein
MKNLARLTLVLTLLLGLAPAHAQTTEPGGRGKSVSIFPNVVRLENKNGNVFSMSATGAGSIRNMMTFSTPVGNRLRMGDSFTSSLDGYNDTIEFNLGNVSFPAMVITTIAGSDWGTNLIYYHNSASPAANDQMMQNRIYGNDSGANLTEYANIIVNNLDPTNGSEDSRFVFNARVAGALVSPLQVGDGVVVGNADSFPGQGNLGIDDSGILKLYETEANGDHSFQLIAPDALGGDVTCTIDASGRIPDSCVGDGVDGGGGAQTPWTSNIDADGFNLDFADATGIRDSAGNEQLIFQETASAVNYLEVTNAATGEDVVIATNGSDADVGLVIRTKSTTAFGIFPHVQFDLQGGSFPFMQVSNTSATDGGPSMEFFHDSSSPAVDDYVGGFVARGRDTAANTQRYGSFGVNILDPTSTTEDGTWFFSPMVAGSEPVELSIHAGVIIGPGTTFPGAGNLSLADAKGIFDGAGNEQLIFQETASAVNYLEVTNAATGTHPLLAAAGSDASVRLHLDSKGSSGKVVVGTGAPASYTTQWFSTFPKFQVIGTDIATSSIASAEFNASAFGPYWSIAHSRNATPNLHTVVVANDELGALTFEGSDGTNFETGAMIQAHSDGTPGNNDMPGRLSFYTTPDAGFTPTARLVIKNDGGVIVGANGTSPGAGNVSLADAKGIFDDDGDELLIFQDNGGTDVNWFEITNSIDGVNPTISVAGSTANLGMTLASKGTINGSVSSGSFLFNAGDGITPFVVFTGTNAGAFGGPTFVTYNDSSTPAAADLIGALESRGRDSAATVGELYTAIQFEIIDPTNGSEDGKIELTTNVAGAGYVTQASMADGVVIGSGTTYPGTGNLAFGADSGIYSADASVRMQVDNSSVNGLDGFNDTIKFSLEGALPSMQINVTDAGGWGPVIQHYHDSSTPAANDFVGYNVWYGRDGGGALTDYADIVIQLLDPTNGSEDSQIYFAAQVAGSVLPQLKIGAGIMVANGDSFPGAGNLGIDDSGELRFYETEANGDDYVAFIAQGTLTGNRTCTFQDGAAPIPDSCVGDGVDAGAGGGLANVVEDADPELGGNLNTNTFNIILDASDFLVATDATGVLDESLNEQLIFQTTASAVNYLEITNAATGTFPIVAAQGSDSDVGMTFSVKGSPSNGFQFNSGAANGGGMQITGTAVGQTGPSLVLFGDSSSPANSDFIGAIRYNGHDNGAGTDEYASIQTRITDVTAGSEDGVVHIFTLVNGTSNNLSRFRVGGGVSLGQNFPADPGDGSISFDDNEGLYDANANEVVLLQTVASAVNYLDVFNSATGTYPIIAANGSDTDIGMIFTAKGSPATPVRFNLGATNYPDFLVTNTDTVDGGPLVKIFHDSATPAAGDDIGTVAFNARDSAANNQRYADIWTQLTDATDATEDAELFIRTAVAGTVDRRISVGEGVIVGNGATYPGVGNLMLADAKYVMWDDTSSTDSSITVQQATGFNNMLIENADLFVQQGGGVLAGNISPTQADAENIRSRADAFVFPQVQFHAESATGTQSNANMVLHRWSTDAVAGYLAFGKSRGTSSTSYTVVAASDVLGELIWNGADGTDNEVAAGIRAEVDGTPGDNDMPGALFFATTADAAATATDRMAIRADGRFVHSTNGSLTALSFSSGFLATQPKFQVNSTGDNGFALTAWAGNSASANNIMAKSRGTSVGTMTVVQDNDNLGIWAWDGADGTTFETAATIRAKVDGTPGNDDMPGRIEFATTADAGVAPTNRMTIKSTGTIIAGAGTTEYNFDPQWWINTPIVQVQSINDARQGFGAAVFKNSVFPTSLTLARSRGATVGDFTLVQNNDELGMVAFTGSDGAEFAHGANITARVDGTPGDNDMPTRLVFETVPDNSVAPQKRMAIKSDGGVIVGPGTTSPGTSNLLVGTGAAQTGVIVSPYTLSAIHAAAGGM